MAQLSTQSIRRRIAKALLVVPPLLVGSPLAAEELSVATFMPPQHHINKNLFGWFGEEIVKRSNGSLTMKLFPAGQLGAGPVQQWKRVVEGVADITFGVQAYTPTLFPRSMLIIPPGKSTTAKESTERLWRVYDRYLAQEYKAVKAMGAVPVQMPVTQMYIGLSTGTIDATYASFNNITPPWNF